MLSRERMTLTSYLIDHWLPTGQSSLRPSTFARYDAQTLRLIIWTNHGHT